MEGAIGGISEYFVVEMLHYFEIRSQEIEKFPLTAKAHGYCQLSLAMRCVKLNVFLGINGK